MSEALRSEIEKSSKPGKHVETRDGASSAVAQSATLGAINRGAKPSHHVQAPDSGLSEAQKAAFVQDRNEKKSKNCSQCVQGVFREGLCIDHFRAKNPGGIGKTKLVDGKKSEEVIDEKMREKFKGLTRKNYKDQAIWYLNGFWKDGADEQAEDVWVTWEKFVQQDKRKKEGNELNEVEAHHYLQSTGKTMTALELRNELRRIDVDANGQMALLEYLLFFYQRLVSDCLNNPQGGGPEEQKALAEAQRQVEALNAALADLQVQLANQREAEAHAKASEAKAKQAEQILRDAEAEAKKAAAELQKQEDDYKAQIKALEDKKNNDSLGMVARNKASQELAQLKEKDPLPLRRAKITQDAAVRKVELERKLAEAARKAAEEERKKAEEQTRKTEAAVADTEKKMAEATATLEKLRQQGGVPRGAIWWMQREVTEAKKYMPRSKQ